MRRMTVGLAVLTASLLTAGCQLLWPWAFNNQSPAKTGAAGLYQFKSADELKQYLADQYGAKSAPTGGLDILYRLLPVLAPAPVAAPSAADGQNSGAVSGDPTENYSTTNLQEAGVDESDVMKNDADYVYLVKGQELRIAKVQPPDGLAQLSTVPIEGQASNLYLLGDKLVALSQNWPYYYGYADGGIAIKTAAPVAGAPTMPSIVPPITEGTNEVIVTIIDVADRNTPNVVKTYRLEGNLVDSRMVDGRLHIVLTVVPNLPQPAEILNTPLEEILPKFEVRDGNGSAASSGLIADWPNFYRPADPDGYGIIVVATINTNDPNAEIKSVALTADAGLIYASTQALYLTDTDWGYSSGTGEEKTIVHKFSLTDNGAEYASSGSVPGRPLNQFSLGEYQDYLRIATTVGHVAQGGGTATNDVYVLGEGEKNLEVVGKVENIAPGEQIYSARFLGPRGFIVTFKKVDPLFTLDLADPCNPKVVGALKVPGYSNYIHILDENHLLTIGKDADDVGDFAWYQGVQLSIFDVTNFAEPNLMHHEIIGSRGTNSEALNNHKAFNFFAPKALLAIPIDLYEGATGGPTYGTWTFSGLFVYRVTVDEGFQPLGRISTRVENATQPSQFWYYSSNWTRGVFIGDNVYAVTDELIRSAAVSDPNTVIDTLILPSTPTP